MNLGESERWMFQKAISRLDQVRDTLYGRPYLVLLSIGLAAVLVYLAAIPLPRVDGQLVGGDGIRYYMYVRSFWIDGDLNFHNEFLYFFGHEGRTIPATGMAHNQYGIGCALLWTPFFLCAHAMAALLNLVGLHTPMDGYSYLYQATTLLGTVVYGFLGVLLSFRLSARLYPRSSALLATVLIWLASNVLYYMIAEPSLSHANAMFAIALFVYYWYKTGHERSTGQWAVLGLLAALILLIRLPDVTFLIIPAVESLYLLFKILSAQDFKGLWKHILHNVTFLGALFLGFVPQMVAWRIMFGSFLVGGRLYGRGVGSDQFHWFSPRIPQVLFSGWHGLFSWHPILLFASVGLIFFLGRKNKLLAACLTAAFAANLYLISAWRIWWQAAAFGGRMFMSGGIVFVLGLTALVDWLRKRRDSILIEFVALAFIAWNALFMIQYRFGFVSLWDPLTFRELVLDKFTLPLRLFQRLLK